MILRTGNCKGFYIPNVGASRFVDAHAIFFTLQTNSSPRFSFNIPRDANSDYQDSDLIPKPHPEVHRHLGQNLVIAEPQTSPDKGTKLDANNALDGAFVKKPFSAHPEIHTLECSIGNDEQDVLIATSLFSPPGIHANCQDGPTRKDGYDFSTKALLTHPDTIISQPCNEELMADEVNDYFTHLLTSGSSIIVSTHRGDWADEVFYLPKTTSHLIII